jgi:hypothetical protein
MVNKIYSNKMDNPWHMLVLHNVTVLLLHKTPVSFHVDMSGSCLQINNLTKMSPARLAKSVIL